MIAILGGVLLIGGFYFYIQAASQWQQSQIDSIRTWYFGSIGAMILGGLFAIAGIAQKVSVFAKSPEKRNTRTLAKIGVAAIVLVCFGLFNVLRSSPIHLSSPPAVSAPAVRAAPPTIYGGSRSLASSANFEAPVPTREVIRGLTQIRSLEWKYFERYGTFTRNLWSLGITNSVGSPYVVGPHYLYLVRRANKSQVIVEATGKVLTPASGIKLTLLLNADGTARTVQYR